MTVDEVINQLQEIKKLHGGDLDLLYFDDDRYQWTSLCDIRVGTDYHRREIQGQFVQLT